MSVLILRTMNKASQFLKIDYENLNCFIQTFEDVNDSSLAAFIEFFFGAVRTYIPTITYVLSGHIIHQPGRKTLSSKFFIEQNIYKRILMFK